METCATPCQSASLCAVTEDHGNSAIPHRSVPRLLKRSLDVCLPVLLSAEFAIAVAILTALILGVGYLALGLARSMASTVVLDPGQLNAFLDVSLTLFVAIELFRIAVAYLSREDVLHLVLEAAFVAVARKIVLFDFAKSGLGGAGAYGLLLLAVAATYFAISYSQKNTPRP